MDHRAEIQRVFVHIEPLADFPESGSHPPELGLSRYRQIVEPPCRIFDLYHSKTVFILHLMRTERLLRESLLTSRPQP